MRILGRSLIISAIAASLMVDVAFAQPKFAFNLGFRLLANEIPDLVGEPLENEHHNPVNGDSVQQTSTGLMVWRKADNWTAFTNGSTTWVNGPLGLQKRGNGERFKWEVPTPEPGSPPLAAKVQSKSVLADHLLVTWYGNPNTPLMGVLGRFEGAELASGLRQQADAYAQLTDKKILPAYELIAVVAQAGAGSDGLWRRREGRGVIDSMLEQARSNGFVLVLDVQVGHSRVEDELEYLRPYLEEPDVYLALDPEFDMWPGQTPGQQIGHTSAAEINYALRFLEDMVKSKDLPPKVLIVHQFAPNMLPDKERIVWSPVVDLVLDMDGFGNQQVKIGSYRTVMEIPLQFAGVKLFYNYDPDIFTPQEVMKLNPPPSVVIYQ